MSILLLLAEYVLILYGLLGLSVIWLAYEVGRILRRHKQREEGWSTPSPEQAWSSPPPKHTPQPPAQSPVAVTDDDPLKAFLMKEHVTEPMVNAIRPTKKQAKP